MAFPISCTSDPWCTFLILLTKIANHMPLSTMSWKIALDSRNTLSDPVLRRLQARPTQDAEEARVEEPHHTMCRKKLTRLHEHCQKVLPESAVSEKRRSIRAFTKSDPSPIPVPPVIRESVGFCSVAGPQGGAEPRTEDQPPMPQMPPASASSDHCADDAHYSPRATRPAHTELPAHSGTLPGSFRFLWVLISKFLDKWEDCAHLMQPATVVKWHRTGFSLFWRWKSRRRTGRPTIPKQMQDLIRQLSKDNPLWGAETIRETWCFCSTTLPVRTRSTST